MKGIEWFESYSGEPYALLLDKNSYNINSSIYTEWQDHSDILDSIAGFEINEIEANLISMAKNENSQGNHRSWGPTLHEGHQTWVGLSPRQLQTTYKEFYDICSNLMPFKSIMDLGAGYGRLGLVANSFTSDCLFTGYEFVQERVDHGNAVFKQHGLHNLKMIQADISSLETSTFSDTDVFFIYDFGQRSEMDRVLKALNKLWGKRKFQLVARGRGIRSIISNWHPWLNSDQTIHKETYSIYTP